MSHLGFTMATHTCAGHVVESKLVIGKTILNCGMMDESESKCPKSITKKCCDNKFQSLQVNDDFSGISSIDLSSLQANFLPAFVDTFLLPQFAVIANTTEGNNYSPPYYKQDLSVLLQTFRI